MAKIDHERRETSVNRFTCQRCSHVPMQISQNVQPFSQLANEMMCRIDFDVFKFDMGQTEATQAKCRDRWRDGNTGHVAMDKEKGKTIIVIIWRVIFFGFTINQKHVSIETVGHPHLLPIDDIGIRIWSASSGRRFNTAYITSRLCFADTSSCNHRTFSEFRQIVTLLFIRAIDK